MDPKDCLSECIEMLHQIFQAIDLFSRKALRDFGVSGPQIWALRTIAESRVVNMSDLANGVPQSQLHSFQNDYAGASLRPTTMHGSASGDPLPTTPGQAAL